MSQKPEDSKMLFSDRKDNPPANPATLPPRVPLLSGKPDDREAPGYPDYEIWNSSRYSRSGGISANDSKSAKSASAAPFSSEPLSVQSSTLPDTLDDPKEYPLAPFNLNKDESEQVGLNSGNLALSVTDFVLPSKNGFDLAVTRQYNSSMSNESELTPKFESVAWYAWDITFTCRCKNLRTSTNIDIRYFYSDPIRQYSDSIEAMGAAKEEWKAIQEKDFPTGDVLFLGEDGSEQHRILFLWDNDIRISEIKTDAIVSDTRPNNHLTDTYGLGSGWGFGFPSVEVVGELYKKNRVRYYNFLHLGDGQVYKLENNTLKDYKLEDLSFSATSGTLNGKQYHYVLSYKDGRKAYFAGSTQQSIDLIAMTDRFGNTISFDLTADGGSITDTLGRKIYLHRTAISGGYTLTWTLPDNSIIVYTIENGQLARVTNQEGDITHYDYGIYPSDMGEEFRKGQLKLSYKGSDFGDTTATIPYNPLTDITFPSGATSKYIYEFLDGCKGGTLQGSQGMMLLRRRVDYENGAAKNQQDYWYDTAWKTVKTDYDQRLYVKFARVTAGQTVDEYEFEYQKPVSRQVTKVGDEIRRERSIPNHYLDLLPTEEAVSLHQNGKTISSESTWSYDAKGNLLTETLPIKGITTMTYDGLYSLPLSRIYKKDETTEIQEVFELRSDKKVVEWKKIFEKVGAPAPVLKEATSYQYDYNLSTNAGSNNLISERQYANISGNTPQVSGDDRVVHYSYDNTNTALSGAIYNGAFLTKKWISGLKNADGVALPDSVEKYVCDAHGRVLTKTDPCDNKTRYTYDGLGRVVIETFPDGSSKEVEYDLTAEINHFIETEKDRTGAFVRGKRMEYTSLGKISSVYATATSTCLSSYTYDHRNRLSSESSRGIEGTEGTATTYYSYDAFDRVLSKATSGTASGTTLPTSYEERYTYDDAFNPARLYTKQTKEIVGGGSAPSIVSTVLNDLLGRAVEEAVGQAVATTAYDKIGNKISRTDPKGNVISWVYDYGGRILSETRAHQTGKVAAHTSYDCFGNTVKSTDFRGKSTTFSYDVLGRLLEQTSDFSGSQKALTRYAYDGVGNVVSEKVLSAIGVFAETKYVYDNRYRLLDTILSDGKTETRVRNEYDSSGNKTAMYTGMLGASTVGAAKTTYTYDQFGNVTATTDPIGNSPNPSHLEKRKEVYSYDNHGRLRSKRDRNGFVTTYSYDGLGRVLREEVVDSDSTAASSYNAFSWYPNALKSTEENEELKISFSYDNQGQLVEQRETCRQGAANTVIKQYGYDLCGNRIRFVMSKDGVQQILLTYGYDMQNRLLEVLKNDVKLAEYGYDANGNRASLIHPQNGLSSSYVYNDGNLITELINKKDGALRSSYRYRYYLNGNQSQKISGRAGISEKITDYTYDLLGRLTEEKEQSGSTTQYTYDRFSNRLLMTATDASGKSSTTDYAYDLRSRLQVETKKKDKNTEISSYSYDWNGNQIRREWEKFSPKKEKKAPGRAGFVSGKFGEDVVVLERREYNGYNQLIHLYRDTYETRYTYRPDGLRQKKLFADGTVLSHLWDGQNMVAEYGASGAISARYLRGVNLLCREQDNLLQYYQHNAHGDVVQRTDQLGTILKNYDYDAFGVEKNRETLDMNPFRYCGEYFDRESDTIYLRARSYDPGTGRFVGEDPIRAGLNWYAYCGGNPVAFMDSRGLSRETADTTPWQNYSKLNNMNDTPKKGYHTPYAYLGETVEFYRGWKYRIDPAHVKNGKGNHIHLEKGKLIYAQNDDGSPHDNDSNSLGSPPKKVLKKLKEKSGWDWNKYLSKFAETVEIQVYATAPILTARLIYSDGAQAIILNNNALIVGGISPKDIWEAYQTAMPVNPSESVTLGMMGPYFLPLPAPSAPFNLPSFPPFGIPVFG